MTEAFTQGTEVAAPIVSDGQRWLELMGPEYVAMGDSPTGYEYEDGSQVPVRDFHVLCSEHALPIFLALEADPRNPDYLKTARSAFARHFIPQAEG